MYFCSIAVLAVKEWNNVCWSRQGPRCEEMDYAINHILSGGGVWVGEGWAGGDAYIKWI